MPQRVVVTADGVVLHQGGDVEGAILLVREAAAAPPPGRLVPNLQAHEVQDVQRVVHADALQICVYQLESHQLGDRSRAAQLGQRR